MFDVRCDNLSAPSQSHSRTGFDTECAAPLPSSSALLVALSAMALGFLYGCTAAGTTTAAVPSALSGTVDATAADGCAAAYVACVRADGTTCRADVVACVADGTTSADDDDAARGGRGRSKQRGGREGKGSRCNDDGSIRGAEVDACLDELDACARTSAPASTCVTDAVTCATGLVTGDADADAGATLIH